MTIDWTTISIFITITCTLIGVYYNYISKPIWEKFEKISDKIDNKFEKVTNAVGDLNTSIKVSHEAFIIHRDDSSAFKKESLNNQNSINIKINTIAEEQRGLESKFEILTQNLKVNNIITQTHD